MTTNVLRISVVLMALVVEPVTASAQVTLPCLRLDGIESPIEAFLPYWSRLWSFGDPPTGIFDFDGDYYSDDIYASVLSANVWTVGTSSTDFLVAAFAECPTPIGGLDPAPQVDTDFFVDHDVKDPEIGDTVFSRIGTGGVTPAFARAQTLWEIQPAGGVEQAQLDGYIDLDLGMLVQGLEEADFLNIDTHAIEVVVTVGSSSVNFRKDTVLSDWFVTAWLSTATLGNYRLDSSCDLSGSAVFLSCR